MKNLLSRFYAFCSKESLFLIGLELMCLATLALIFYDLDRCLGLPWNILIAWPVCRAISTAVYAFWFSPRFDPKIKSFPLKIFCQYAICEIPAIALPLIFFSILIPDSITFVSAILLFLVDLGVFLMISPTTPR